MKKILHLYILVTVLFSDFLMFAADPGSEDATGTLEGNDAPQAPINGKVIWLAIAGLLFAMYVYKSRKKQHNLK